MNAYFRSLLNLAAKRWRRFAFTARGERVIMYSLFAVVYGVSYLIFYHGFFNLIPLDLPDLGTFPLFPHHYAQMYYFTWLPNQNLGIRGSALSYVVEISFLVRVFPSPAFAQKIWMLSLLPLGSLGIVLLSRTSLKIDRIYSMLFSYTYSFNPVTSGLFSIGSVNDTITAYVFMPFLILLLLKSFTSERLALGIYLLSLSCLFSFVFGWNAEVIMWFVPFAFFYTISLLLTYRNRRILKKVLLSYVIFLFLAFLLNPYSFDVIGSFLSGNGNRYVGQSPNPYLLAMNDFYLNFNGQLSFCYYYLALACSLFSIFYLTKLIPQTDRKLLHFSINAQVLLVLGVWAVFHYNVVGLEILIAKYMLFLAAYEPLPGISLVFSLICVDLLLAIPGIMHYFQLEPELKISQRSSQNVMRHAAQRQFRIRPSRVIATTIVVLLLFGAVGFWRQGSVPSTINMIEASGHVNSHYAVPSSLVQIANWFHSTTNISIGYRVLALPSVLYTIQSLQSYMPWTSFINLSTTDWNYALSDLISFDKTSNFAYMLANSGVKYILVLKGPYVGADASPSNSGNLSFTPSGFTWAISYEAVGNWTQWYHLLHQSRYFKLVGNLSGAAIFSNSAFQGLVTYYSVPSDFNYSSIVFYPSSAGLTYTSSISYLGDNWLGFNTNFKYNWSLVGLSTLTCGPLPANMTYSNLWQPIQLEHNRTYDITFSMKGSYLENNGAFVRFYSGNNGTGSVTGTFGTTSSGNFSNVHDFSFVFNTSLPFESAYLFPTYQKNLENNNLSITFFSNFTIRELVTLEPMPIKYIYDSPTSIVFNVVSKSPILLLYSANYDNGWALLNQTHSTVIRALNGGYFVENSFLINGANGTYTLLYKPQAAFFNFVLLSMIAWVVAIGTVSFLTWVMLVTKRR